jgi:hypothetical protein
MEIHGIIIELFRIASMVPQRTLQQTGMPMDFTMRIQPENALASTVQPDFKASAANSYLGYEPPTRIEQKSHSWFGPMQCVSP